MILKWLKIKKEKKIDYSFICSMLFSFLISIIGREEMLASCLRVACMSNLAVVRIAREKTKK